MANHPHILSGSYIPPFPGTELDDSSMYYTETKTTYVPIEKDKLSQGKIYSEEDIDKLRKKIKDQGTLELERDEARKAVKALTKRISNTKQTLELAVSDLYPDIDFESLEEKSEHTLIKAILKKATLAYDPSDI